MRRIIVALIVAVALLAGCTQKAAADPQPQVITDVMSVGGRVDPAPSYPYTPHEARTVWARTHPQQLTRPQAQAVAQYLNAVILNRIADYVRAVTIAYAQAVAAAQQTCSSPSSCATLVHGVFSRIAPAFASGAPAVMYCESGGNPHASNGGRYLGLMQQSAQYWPARASAYGMAGRSAFDPYANAVVSAHMVAGDGGWRQWECKP